MMRRAEIDLKTWDKQLKFLLFAYCDTPHSVTGFSPFTLLFGREVKGPLSMLKSAWLEGTDENGSVSEWLLCARQKMVEMSLVVSDRELKAKQVMKSQYDKTASVKSFAAGEKVLVRKPGLQSKLGYTWDGPYQIERQVSTVTYGIHIPGKPNKSKILHCNLLRKWTTPAAKIHRVATITLVREDFVPSVEEQALLDSVLKQYDDVLSSDPGRTDVLKLSINTGIDEVRVEIDKLLALGIIRPSDSSIVTVGKKDGGVRICIDFRAINGITQPDPYQMPLI